MLRPLCALLLLVSLHLMEPGSTQQTSGAAQQGPGSLSSITLSSVACVLDQDCLFQLSDAVGYQKIRTSFSGISFVHRCPVTCPSKTYYSQCLCCDQTLPDANELLHTYLAEVEEYDRIYQAFQTSRRQDQQLDLHLQNATHTLQTAANKLFDLCPEFVCREDECKYLRCHRQTCDTETPRIPTSPSLTSSPTATPPSTTPRGSAQVRSTSTAETGTTDSGSVTTAAVGQGEPSSQDGPNVAALALGVVLSVLVVAAVVVVVCWWRRRGRKKGGKPHHSPSTIAFVQDADADGTPYSEIGDVNMRDPYGKANINRESGEHEYSVIPADQPKFTHPNDSGYDVARDVTNRKLPSVPVEGDGNSVSSHQARRKLKASGGFGETKLDEDYSVAQNPDRKNGILQKASGTPEVPYSLAKATAGKEIPPYLDLQGKGTGEGEAAEGEATGGQYFVLEKQADDFDNAKLPDGQYFVLESDNAAENDQQETTGQYFVLEDAENYQQTTGQYFVLENGADKEKETAGQSFVLEKESADDSNNAKLDSEDTNYSSLDQADMAATARAAQDCDYTALEKPRAEDAPKNHAAQSEFESEYSFQKPV